MQEIVSKLIALWLAGLNPVDGAPAHYISAYDADTVKVGFACQGPVVATVTFTGLTDVPVDAKPLVLRAPCSHGTVPMDVRVTGIDSPEVGSSPCATREERDAERRKGLVARDAARKWLRGADRLALHDVDVVTEKWGRALARIEYREDNPDSGHVIYDLGAKLIVMGYARPYNGGQKSSFCGTTP